MLRDIESLIEKLRDTPTDDETLATLVTQSGRYKAQLTFANTN